jgi:cytochrome c-type biogenesis protein CcmH/NrfG
MTGALSIQTPRRRRVGMGRTLAGDQRQRLHASGRRLLALAPGLMACLLAVSSCEEPSPQQRVENAQAFLERGNAQLAIAELKRVLQEQPDDADARVMLGKIYLTGGELPYAEKELERAKALGIDSAELMVTLGELWLKQGAASTC